MHSIVILQSCIQYSGRSIVWMNESPGSPYPVNDDGEVEGRSYGNFSHRFNEINRAGGPRLFLRLHLQMGFAWFCFYLNRR